MSQPEDIVTLESVLRLFAPTELLQQGWSAHRWSIVLAATVMAALAGSRRLRSLAGAPLWPGLLLIGCLEASLETYLFFESGHYGIRWGVTWAWFVTVSSGIFLAALLALCMAIAALQRDSLGAHTSLTGLGAAMALFNVIVNWVFIVFLLTVVALTAVSRAASGAP